jgi:hypothetical protein
MTTGPGELVVPDQVSGEVGAPVQSNNQFFSFEEIKIYLEMCIPTNKLKKATHAKNVDDPPSPS